MLNIYRSLNEKAGNHERSLPSFDAFTESYDNSHKKIITSPRRSNPNREVCNMDGCRRNRDRSRNKDQLCTEHSKDRNEQWAAYHLKKNKIHANESLRGFTECQLRLDYELRYRKPCPIVFKEEKENGHKNWYKNLLKEIDFNDVWMRGKLHTDTLMHEFLNPNCNTKYKDYAVQMAVTCGCERCVKLFPTFVVARNPPTASEVAETLASDEREWADYRKTDDYKFELISLAGKHKRFSHDISEELALINNVN